MKLSSALQVLAILIVWILPSTSFGRRTGYDAVNAESALDAFNDLSLADFCKLVSQGYAVPVFLEKGLSGRVSFGESNLKFGETLRLIIKPLGLHAHFDSVGIFITRKPIPNNFTHLAGVLEVELAIPTGRVQQSHDDYAANWVQGDSVIYAGWKKSGSTTLVTAIEERLDGIRTLYKFTHEPKSVVKDGKEYLAMRYVIPRSVTFNGKTTKLYEQDMVYDAIYFKKGDYLYTVSHTYPQTSAKAGAVISKQLLEKIKWQQISKYNRFGRLR